MGRPLVALLDDWDKIGANSAAIEELRGFADVRIFETSLGTEEIGDALKGYDAVIAIRERTRFTAELLKQLPDLKHIAQTGKGFAHIDLKAAAAGSVSVSVTAGGSAGAVAELTLGLMLSLARHIGEGNRSIQGGGFQSLVGRELYGKTLGLIGLGVIGKEVASRARAFGMNLLAWSRNLTPELAAPYGVQVAPTLEALLGESDFISIHTWLSEESRGLLSYDRLRLAKRGAVLINTARSPIAPESDIVRALDEGILGGAGIDVFDNEPLPVRMALRNRSNVVMTPHVGWVTHETYERFLTAAVQNLRSFVSGRPTNLVNSEAVK